MLSQQQEDAFVRRWRDHSDQQAAYHLVTSHLRLVAKLAMRYRGYGLPVAEMISEGNIGLMQAVKRFDPDKGVRLATYAMWWIKAAIHEYVLRSWSIVKFGMAKTQRRLFFSLKRAKSKIAALQDGDLRHDQTRLIAQSLDVSQKEIVETDRRLRGDVSLNVPVGENGESGELQDWLVDESPCQETLIGQKQEYLRRTKALSKALADLNVRERKVFMARRMDDSSRKLDELASELNVSRERV